MTTITLAFAGLRRRWLRTALSVISVATATAVFTVTFAALLRFEELRNADAKLPRVLVFSETGGRPLPQAYASRLEALEGVQWVWWVAASRGNVTGADGRKVQFSIWAAPPRFYELQTPALLGTSAEANTAWKGDRQGALVSEGLLEKLQKRIGDTLTFASPRGQMTVRIVGLHHGAYATGNLLMMMHYDHLSEAGPPAQRGNVGNFVVGGEDAASLPALARRIDENFATAVQPTFSLPSWSAMNSGVFRPMMSIPYLLQTIALFILVVTTVVTSSTIAMSLRERRSDFGVLRALGFSPGRVFGLVFAETQLLCLLGAAIGVGVPLVLWSRNGLELGPFVMSDVTIGLWPALAGVLVTGVIGALAVVWPATETARLDVVAVLGKA